MSSRPRGSRWHVPTSTLPGDLLLTHTNRSTCPRGSHWRVPTATLRAGPHVTILHVLAHHQWWWCCCTLTISSSSSCGYCHGCLGARANKALEGTGPAVGHGVATGQGEVVNAREDNAHQLYWQRFHAPGMYFMYGLRLLMWGFHHLVFPGLVQEDLGPICSKPVTETSNWLRSICTRSDHLQALSIEMSS
jgi:hypothetical protein